MSKEAALESRQSPCGSSKRKHEPSPDCCCAICHEVLLDPITLPCGHTLDKKCLHDLLASGQAGVAQRCPICRANLPRTLPQVSTVTQSLMEQFFPEAVKRRREEVTKSTATMSLHTAVFRAYDPALRQIMEQRVQQETNVEVLQGHLAVSLEREVFRLQGEQRAVRSKTDIVQLRARVLEAIRKDEHMCTVQAVAVRLAIREDAEVNQEDEEYGITPLHHAINEEDVWVMRPLIEAGADVNSIAIDGGIPLYKAIFIENSEAMRLLVKGGAHVNWADESGLTPLHTAASNNRVEAMRVLVEAGADVNLANKDGKTPLHRTACIGCEVAVEMLLKAGADVDQRRQPDGQTPLEVAIAEGNTEVARVLEQADAGRAGRKQQGVDS